MFSLIFSGTEELSN